jgi:hypothetical protein
MKERKRMEWISMETGGGGVETWKVEGDYTWNMQEYSDATFNHFIQRYLRTREVGMTRIQ